MAFIWGPYESPKLELFLATIRCRDRILLILVESEIEDNGKEEELERRTLIFRRKRVFLSVLFFF